MKKRNQTYLNSISIPQRVPVKGLCSVKSQLYTHIFFVFFYYYYCSVYVLFFTLSSVQLGYTMSN